MRETYLNSILVIALILLLNFTAINIFSQNQPLNKEQIKTALDSIKTAGSERNKREFRKVIIATIKKQGVDFKMTEAEGKEFLALGSTTEINKAIVENFKGIDTSINTDKNISNFLPPFNKFSIREELLKDSSLESQQNLIEQIKVRKYKDDPLNESAETYFKSLNATAELIETIKKNPLVEDVLGANEWRHQKTGMQFVLVQKGSFRMGSTTVGAENPVENETPIRTITFAKEFFIGRFEVTQGEWQELMGNAREKVMAQKGNNQSLDDILGENYPMVGVNWDDAKQFISKMNESDDGYVYSLPTEAEWEYACRAGTTTKYSFGDDITAEQASFYVTTFPFPPKYNTPEKLINKLHPIDTYPPNAWGIYGMHGNASEWVEDYYAPTYPSLPVNGSANLKIHKDYIEDRILRGGGWSSPSRTFLASSVRNRMLRSFANLATGFRVVAKKKEVPRPK